MRERLKHQTAAAALLLVTGGSLVACSDEGGSSGVGESAGGTLTKATFLDELEKSLVVAGSSHVKLSIDAAGQAIQAEGDFSIGKTPADSAMALTMDAGQTGLGSAEIRLVDETVYANLGPMTSNKFTAIDLNDKSNPLGQQFSNIAGSVDLTRQFKDFESAVQSFEQKGEPKELDGVEALPYVITVDTSKITTPKRAEQSVPKTLEYTIYVGPDNLPRRMLTQIPGAGEAAATADYSRWGEDVSITKPKASEITEKDLFSQLGGRNPEGA